MAWWVAGRSGSEDESDTYVSRVGGSVRTRFCSNLQAPRRATVEYLLRFDTRSTVLSCGATGCFFRKGDSYPLTSYKGTGWGRMTRRAEAVQTSCRGRYGLTVALWDSCVAQKPAFPGLTSSELSSHTHYISV